MAEAEADRLLQRAVALAACVLDLGFLSRRDQRTPSRLEQAALAVQMLWLAQMVSRDRILYSAQLLAPAAARAYLETIHFLLVLEETAVLAVVEQEVQVEALEIRLP